MAFKVFLSYGVHPDEQIIVWRLQTLAASHGIHLFVPSRQGFKLPSSRQSVPSAQVRKEIDDSDCVLAMITSAPDPAVTSELNYALGKSKLIIPVVQYGVNFTSFQKLFPNYFVFKPGEPTGTVEAGIMQFLKQQQVTKDQRQAIGAIVAIGLSLLLLSSLAEK